MFVCPHCDEDLVLKGTVVIACACANSVYESRLEKAQQLAYRQERDRLNQQERERRRKERRKRVALSKER